jgi:hypothetical protein
VHPSDAQPVRRPASGGGLPRHISGCMVQRGLSFTTSLSLLVEASLRGVCGLLVLRWVPSPRGRPQAGAAAARPHGPARRPDAPVLQRCVTPRGACTRNVLQQIAGMWPESAVGWYVAE